LKKDQLNSKTKKEAVAIRHATERGEPRLSLKETRAERKRTRFSIYGRRSKEEILSEKKQPPYPKGGKNAKTLQKKNAESKRKTMSPSRRSAGTKGPALAPFHLAQEKKGHQGGRIRNGKGGEGDRVLLMRPKDAPPRGRGA